MSYSDEKMVASARSTIRKPCSTSSLVTTKGGINRMTFPCVPQESSRSLFARHSFWSAETVAASGVPSSFRNSTPTIKPSPLISAILG